MTKHNPPTNRECRLCGRHIWRDPGQPYQDECMGCLGQRRWDDQLPTVQSRIGLKIQQAAHQMELRRERT